MSYVIVLDSSAQLPESFIQTRPIKILPLRINLNGTEFSDRTSEQDLVKLYASGEISVDAKIESLATSVDQIRQYMVEEVVPHYEVAVCQTIAKAYSATYDHYTQAIEPILSDARELRGQTTRPFRMVHTNTGNTSTGQGLIAVYADVALAKGLQYNEYASTIAKFKARTKAFTVLKDMVYGRHKSKQRGASSVSFPTALLMNAVGAVPVVCNSDDEMWVIGIKPKFEKAVNGILIYAMERIKEGLLFNCIILSIAADTAELDNFDEFANLKKVAAEYGVKIMVNVMTLSITCNYGPGSFSLGIAPKNTKAEP